MLGAEEQRLRRMTNTPQACPDEGGGGATEGNPAKRGTDDTVDGLLPKARFALRQSFDSAQDRAQGGLAELAPPEKTKYAVGGRSYTTPVIGPSIPPPTGLRANGGKLKSHAFSVHAEP